MSVKLSLCFWKIHGKGSMEDSVIFSNCIFQWQIPCLFLRANTIMWATCVHTGKERPLGHWAEGKKTTTTKRLESLGLDLDYTHSHTACRHSLIPVVFWLLVQHGVLISHHSSHLNINTPIRPKGFLAATIHKPHTACSKCVSLMHVHGTVFI